MAPRTATSSPAIVSNFPAKRKPEKTKKVKKKQSKDGAELDVEQSQGTYQLYCIFCVGFCPRLPLSEPSCAQFGEATGSLRTITVAVSQEVPQTDAALPGCLGSFRRVSAGQGVAGGVARGLSVCSFPGFLAFFFAEPFVNGSLI